MRKRILEFIHCFCGPNIYLALEALLVPLGVQRDDRLIGDRASTAVALGRKDLLEVGLAVGLAVTLEEHGTGQRLVAWSAACEVMLVPAVAQGFDDFLCEYGDIDLVY